jgi:hypothetical protein
MAKWPFATTTTMGKKTKGKNVEYILSRTSLGNFTYYMEYV